MIIVSITLSWFTLGCESGKITQCEQIFQIARGVTKKNKNVSYVNDQQPVEMRSWLQAANKLDAAANKIKALKIDNSTLIQYQHQLASIYQIYAQATYDAVSAKENKSLDALESARTDATDAGKMQQNLIQEINAYCLEDIK